MPGEEVVFDGSGSFDADNDPITSYQWNFGDDSTGNGVNPMHTYLNPGTYTVILIVSDGTDDSAAAIAGAYIGTDPDAVHQVILELALGWNLISINVMPQNTSRDQVLSSIDGEYDALWTYSASQGEWWGYVPDGPDLPHLNNLNEITPSEGFWVNMIQTGMLMLQGTQPETAIMLEPGWNLVGYNSRAAKPIEDCMVSVEGIYSSVLTYDPFGDVWLQYTPNGTPFPNPLEFMQPGKAYWIHVEQDCLWDVGP
jgi:PKD repeat protein